MISSGSYAVNEEIDVIAQLDKLSQERVHYHKDKITNEYKSWRAEQKKKWYAIPPNARPDLMLVWTLQCEKELERMLRRHHEFQSKVDLGSIDSCVHDCELYLADLHEREGAAWARLRVPLQTELRAAFSLKGFTTQAKYRHAIGKIGTLLEMLDRDELDVSSLCKDSSAANSQCGVTDSLSPNVIFDVVREKLKLMKRKEEKRLTKEWAADMRSLYAHLEEASDLLERAHRLRLCHISERNTERRASVLAATSTRASKLQALAGNIMNYLQKSLEIPGSHGASNKEAAGDSSLINADCSRGPLVTINASRNCEETSAILPEFCNQSAGDSLLKTESRSASGESGHLAVGGGSPPSSSRLKKTHRSKEKLGSLCRSRVKETLNANLNAGRPRTPSEGTGGGSVSTANTANTVDTADTADAADTSDEDTEDRDGEEDNSSGSIVSSVSVNRKAGLGSSAPTSSQAVTARSPQANPTKPPPATGRNTVKQFSVHSQFDPHESIQVWSRPEALPSSEATAIRHAIQSKSEGVVTNAAGSHHRNVLMSSPDNRKTASLAPTTRSPRSRSAGNNVYFESKDRMQVNQHGCEKPLKPDDGPSGRLLTPRNTGQAMNGEQGGPKKKNVFHILFGCCKWRHCMEILCPCLKSGEDKLNRNACAGHSTAARPYSDLP